MRRLEEFLADPSSIASSARVKKYSDIEFNNKKYPLLSVHYGNPSGPALLMTGGVHGLERIGAQLTLSLLESFQQRLKWDETLNAMLEKIQVVFVPLVNPAGYLGFTRSNGSGVDLMRNAPIECEESPPFLLGGHRYSSALPWYRGEKTETETQFLIDTVKDILKSTDCMISLDAHSGFGLRDQLWYPFANSRKTFTQSEQLTGFFELLKNNHPYHIYKIEPQSKVFMTHGDIWDYCYLNFKKTDQVYLPLTLEMGSWIWVKKNPLQLLSKTGIFNPIKSHRVNRTLRRHRALFDFMLHSLVSHKAWSQK